MELVRRKFEEGVIMLGFDWNVYVVMGWKDGFVIEGRNGCWGN